MLFPSKREVALSSGLLGVGFAEFVEMSERSRIVSVKIDRGHIFRTRSQVLPVAIFKMFFLLSGALDACYPNFVILRGCKAREGLSS